MKIELTILNNENRVLGQEPVATWHSRQKSIESDWIEEDFVDLVKGHSLERLTITHAQISSKSQIDIVVKMLLSAKENLQF
jgi:hypothetical protein